MYKKCAIRRPNYQMGIERISISVWYMVTLLTLYNYKQNTVSSKE